MVMNDKVGDTGSAISSSVRGRLVPAMLAGIWEDRRREREECGAADVKTMLKVMHMRST